MANTRSQLVAACIYEVDETGETKAGGLAVDCMFNPFEYTVKKSNSFEHKAKNKSSLPTVEFKQAGPQTLSLKLTFDTYESGEDVSLITNKLWKFMEPPPGSSGSKKTPPPGVVFEWGVFRFVAVITSMSQAFTLFLPDGTPVRANVDVTFTQHIDVNDYPRQNPTSGGGAVESVWRVTAADRLDTIAQAVYGSATHWRKIADRNQLRNPLDLRPGQLLIIPPDKA